MIGLRIVQVFLGWLLIVIVDSEVRSAAESEQPKKTIIFTQNDILLFPSSNH